MDSAAHSTAIEAFTVDCTWHETREPYADTIRDRNGARMLGDLRWTLNDHDQFGRTYRVTVHYADGSRKTLTPQRRGRAPCADRSMKEQIETARQACRATCAEVGTDPVEAENAVLSIGREFLPPHARAVLLDRESATVEYWQWLAREVAAGAEENGAL
jgi:hypothetical protein